MEEIYFTSIIDCEKYILHMINKYIQSIIFEITLLMLTQK